MFLQTYLLGYHLKRKKLINNNNNNYYKKKISQKFYFHFIFLKYTYYYYVRKIGKVLVEPVPDGSIIDSSGNMWNAEVLIDPSSSIFHLLYFYFYIYK